MDFTNRSSRCWLSRELIYVSLITVVGLIGRASLNAQILTVDVGAVADAQSDAAHQGFAILKAESKTVETLEDFDRYAGKKAWELAFRAIDSLDEAGNRGMVPAENGFLVPTGDWIKQRLIRLPPEGREAYRLFNDANAKRLWDRIQIRGGKTSPDELPMLRKLVDRYFLTSVGDLAADRLGDSLFEQGNFTAAEGLWRLIIEKYPDGHLSPAKLQVKRCVALARIGRIAALSALVAQVSDQYSDQTTTIGGQRVVAAEFVRSLLSKESLSRQLPTRDAESFILPATDEPLWQIRMVGPNMSGQANPRTRMPMTFQAAPTVAIADNRLYANWLGTIYAVDLETGKMLWRTGNFIEAPQRAINYLGDGRSTECLGLVPSGGKLFVLRPPTTNQLGEVLAADSARDVMLAIECLDAASGKTLWRAPRLDMTVFAGPYLVDGVEYLIAFGNGNRMNLVAIDMETGHVQLKISLDIPQNANNGGGRNDFGGPKMLASGDRLYVTTDNGAFLAFDLASHEIEWALKYDSNSTGNPQQSTLLESDGVVYLKDGSARLLYALDPAEPSVKWNRPITAEESVVAIDGPIVYLMGHELSALNLKSRKLLWSTKLPVQQATLRPLFCPDHIFVATSRGVFDIDPANGGVRRIFRGADRESSGGKLLLAGAKLICVSDTAVTAYPIQRAKPTRLTDRDH